MCTVQERPCEWTGVATCKRSNILNGLEGVLSEALEGSGPVLELFNTLAFDT